MSDTAKQLQNEQAIPSDSAAVDAPEILEEIDDAETLFVDESSVKPEQEPALNLQDAASFEDEALESDAQDAPPGDENPSDAFMAELAQMVEGLKSQLEERNAQYMRIAADFDNFRRRTLKEKEELEDKIKCSTISELLPVVDNFERARLQLKPQTEGETNLHKSYQSVYKQLVDCLKRVGVAPMRSEGKAFDPALHEAVVREATDQQEEGTVIEELVRGYLLGDRVLRHALVKVAVPLDDVEYSDEAEPTDEAEES
jgi:molecular chaperone GrpE